MRLEIIRSDLRLLAAALVLPIIVACDSGVSVTPAGSSTSSDISDPVVDVVGDVADETDATTDNSEEVVDVVETGGQSSVCVDTAPLGDGWGWDGSASCRLGETSADNVGDATDSATDDLASGCVDTAPIGDGWGWDGTGSCRIGSAPIVTAPNTSDTADSTSGNVTAAQLGSITDLVLVTGQSNALGAGTSFDAALDAPNVEVMAYTNQGWQIANLNQVWDRNWYPRNDPNTPPSNNFSLHFGKRVAERSTDRVVGIILVTSPGSAISDWGPNSDLFNSIRDKVSLAINDLPYKSRLDAILWHQGESDGQDRDEYSAALYGLISRFRSEPWFDDGRPFICGETASSPVNNQLNRLNSDADPWTSCVEAAGLAVLPGTDHFNASSLRTLGQRYADEYLKIWLGIE